MAEQLPIKDCAWLICGGRDFSDWQAFEASMDMACGLRGYLPARVVHGGAAGADMLAHRWARSHFLEVIAVLADWDRLGRSAGPARNAEMLRRHHPELVVAFPGGRGTADMVAKARASGVDVLEVGLRWTVEGQA